MPISRHSQETHGKTNPDRVAQAVNDVTGGILDHNGGKLIAPKRDMSQSTFDRTMYGLTDKDLAGVTTLNGQEVGAIICAIPPPSKASADGRYYVKLGRTDEAGHCLFRANTESPQKFMLDLRNRPQGVPGHVAFQPMSAAQSSFNGMSKNISASVKNLRADAAAGNRHNHVGRALKVGTASLFVKPSSEPTVRQPRINRF